MCVCMYVCVCVCMYVCIIIKKILLLVSIPVQRRISRAHTTMCNSVDLFGSAVFRQPRVLPFFEGK